MYNYPSKIIGFYPKQENIFNRKIYPSKIIGIYSKKDYANYKIDNMKSNNKFDWLFYLNLYPDLRKNGIVDEESALNHYLNFGIMENRAHNILYVKNHIIENYNKINNEKILYKQKYIDNNIQDERNVPFSIRSKLPFFNILIRTSSRDEHFKKCINSVLNQKYYNYRIIVCYDTPDSLEYIKKYDNIDKLFYYNIENSLNKKTQKYKFNLYCNSLLRKVENGFIIFLDDDDLLTHNYVLNIISDNIKSQEDFLIWKYFRLDKLIYPQNLDNIKLGEITTTSFCFHSKYKNKSKWWRKQYGDYNFVSKLLKSDIKFNIKFVNSILTKGDIDVNNIKIGNFGK